MRVERHTSVNRMIGDGEDGSRRRADSPLPSTMALVRLITGSNLEQYALSRRQPVELSQGRCDEIIDHSAAHQLQVAPRHSGPTVGDASAHQPHHIVESYSSPIGKCMNSFYRRILRYINFLFVTTVSAVDVEIDCVTGRRCRS